MSRCNVGSKTPYDNAQWVEYMTSKRECDAAQRAAQERPRQALALKFVGIGNETWGCGGNMRPEYAADINRRYATFANTPREMGPSRSPRRQPMTTISSFAETMMKDGGRFEACRVHYYAMPRIFRDKGPATGFPRKRMDLDLAACAPDRRRSSARPPRSWTSTIPQKKDGAVCRRMGLLVRSGAGSQSRLPRSSRTACAMRRLRRFPSTSSSATATG